MNINDIIELLKRLGVTCKTDENNLYFYDTNNNPMNVYETQLDHIPKKDLEQFDPSYFFTLSGENKMVWLTICHPIINKKRDKKYLIARDIEYGNDREYVKVVFDTISKEVKIRICPKLNDNYLPENATEISFDDRGRLTINKEDKGWCGFEDEDAFKFNLDLEPSDIIDIINSNEIIPIATDYYEKFRPEFKETMQRAKEKAEETRKTKS